MNATAKIRLHGVSLPFAPIEPDAAPRKTPLELAQAARMPLGGALSGTGTRKPATEPAREALELAPIVAILAGGPITAAEVARKLNLPTERVTKALTMLRSDGKAVMQSRKARCLANLWGVPGAEFPPEPIRVARGSAPKEDPRRKTTSQRIPQFLRLIGEGEDTCAAICRKLGLSQNRASEVLRHMIDAGLIKRETIRLGNKGNIVRYEVAQ